MVNFISSPPPLIIKKHAPHIDIQYIFLNILNKLKNDYDRCLVIVRKDDKLKLTMRVGS